MSWITFVIGCVLSAMFGGVSGLLITCLLVAAKDSDEQMERIMNTYEQESE